MSSVRRAFVRAVLTALVVLAVGPVALATAEPPTLTLESPTNGSVGNNSAPTFSGTSNDPLDPIFLEIFEGSSASGAVVQAATGAPSPDGKWELAPSSGLKDGTYTAQATQTNLALEIGMSGSVTFSVDTTEPTVTISTPAEGATLDKANPVFAGTAGNSPGDEATITLKIYAGTIATGTPTVELPLARNGETWTTESPGPQLAEGNYTAEVEQSDEAGNTGHSAPHTFIVDTAPAITINPTSKGVKAGVGESAVFTAAASGAPTPTVQWEESKDFGVTWTDDMTDSGNTTATLTVIGATVAESGREFRAVFTNLAGTITSMAATLTVSEQAVAPAITGNPVDQAVLTGEGAAFMASASGVPTPAAQWQVSTNGGLTWANDTSDAGSTTGTLTILSAKLAENGRQYRAVFTNSTSTATSAPATLTVAKRAVAPVVTAHPSGKRVVAGEVATFAASASGVPTPEVRWQVSTNGGLTWVNDTSDAGGATGTLTVAGTTGAENGYEYRAVFTNQAGTVTSASATLTVDTPVSLAPLVPPAVPAPPATPTPGPAPSPPTAAFTSVPAKPTTGQSVALVSSSTDADSPITAFAWDLAGAGTFTAGGPVITTSFSTPGNHTVRLRVTDANGLTSVATQTIAVSAAPLVLMQPFPVVRIAGSESASGVKISLLSVQAPVGTRVSVTCGGRHCPSRSESRVVVSSRSSGKTGGVLLTFARFERSLQAGLILEIRVSKPGEIGKYTSFRIRLDKPPARVDACVGPIHPAPIPCPRS